jgi:hypothetical protein
MIDKRKKKDSQASSNTGKPGSRQALASIKLPKPALTGGKTVLKSLQMRKTTREISDKKLPLQLLSNLLWAACGVNRKKVPLGICGRTAASASNSQEIDVYVAMQEGVYLYNPLQHGLEPVIAGDLRGLALGPFQPDSSVHAPIRFIYVADIDRLENTSGYPEPGLKDPEIQKSYYYVDTGMIAGNVYLFAAAHGLAAWFHNCNRSALAAQLNLRADRRVLFGQTVGYPGRKK